MYHKRIEKALSDRMTEHHLDLIIQAAERALVNDESKVEVSPCELLALVGEVLQSRRPVCNCGVSQGIRGDHEAECAAAYLHRKG